jgi:glycosyltransferase involved in cell wall biosynthesis
VTRRTIKISIIIPAYQAEKVIPACLEGIKKSLDIPHELIVVDDQSTDLTPQISRGSGAKLLQTPNHAGPAAARNVGARHASGDVLLFIDSDVVIRPDTLARVASHFQSRSAVVAAFGSYDDEPADRDFLSQYKNLQHHFVHQNANTDAATFWAGCGAVRRDVFFAVGGFDESRYRKPSIEDIELGYRLRAGGYGVVLDKQLCVKHLKKWTFSSHVRTEIFGRAIPWSKLILESGDTIRDLNLTLAHRVSGALVYLLMLSIVLLAFRRFFIVPAMIAFLGILLLNRRLYQFFLRHRGFLFLLKSIPLHLLHYAYSTAAFAVCWIIHSFNRIRRVHA